MTGKVDTSKKDEGGLRARGAVGKRNKAAAAGKRNKAVAALPPPLPAPKRPPSASGEPKRPPSAFVTFMTEFKQEYNAQHPDDKSSDLAVTKAAAAKWRDMSEQEKQPYVDQANQKKKQYSEEHEPERPCSAFVVFVTEFRQEYSARHPIKSELAVIEAAAAKWRDMSEQEKQPYVDRFNQN